MKGLGHSQEAMYYRSMIDMCGRTNKMVHWNYSMKLMTKLGEYAVEKVVGLDITRDFEVGFTDNIVATVKIQKPKYNQVVYPNRNELYATLILTQVTEHDAGMRLDRPKHEVMKYRAFLVDPIDHSADPKTSNNAFDNEDKLNQDHNLIEVKIQLIDERAVEMKKISFGQIASGYTDDVLKGMLSSAVKTIKPKYVQPIDGISLSNRPQKEKKHYKEVDDMIIPHGTPILELPRFMNEKWGVFENGINIYLHKNQVYLYETYSTHEAFYAPGNITLSLIPRGNLLNLKRTYLVNGTHMEILVSSNSSISDQSSAKTVNEGDGVTWFDANKMKNELLTYEDGKPYLDPTSAKKQAFYHKRADDSNYAPMIKGKLSNNSSAVQSAMAFNGKQIINVIWEYSNWWIIPPGSKVSLTYYRNGKQKSATGVILRQTSVVQLEGNMAANRHVCTSVLSLLLTVDQKERKDDYGDVPKTMNSLFDTLHYLLS